MKDFIFIILFTLIVLGIPASLGYCSFSAKWNVCKASFPNDTYIEHDFCVRKMSEGKSLIEIRDELNRHK